MNKHIAILRGINVGGRRKIKMADLKEHLSTLGYQNIVTYIQSGNVIFEEEKGKPANEIEQEIADLIKKVYDFEVPVIVRSKEEIEAAITKNPFAKAETDIKTLHLTFLKEKPSEEQLEKANSYDHSPDQFEIQGKNAFVYCETGYGKTKLNNQFFESKLKVTATTRNWKTVHKLLALSEE